MDNVSYFITNGVYVFKGDYDSLFVCTPVSSNFIGKLTRYKKETDTMYSKTNISFFLNCYPEDDIKSLFLDRSNYEIIGKIDSNYKFSKDGNYLLKEKC